MADATQDQPASEYRKMTWQRFINFCHKLGHGTIERLEIHEGVPTIAETVKSKVKFTGPAGQEAPAPGSNKPL